MVGPDRRVLDVGCATGYLGRSLKQLGCTVTGIEVDAEAAEVASKVLDRVVTGDFLSLDLDRVLRGDRFDAIVFGDVLEHLPDPQRALDIVKPFLAPGGHVVASIPNIAHGSVRLALLTGEFRYRELGLLDATHLRFFTRASIDELFDRAGFTITRLARTTAGLFETELGVDPARFPAELVRLVEAQPEAETYQFVVAAAPAAADQASHDSDRAERMAELAEDAPHLRVAGMAAERLPPPRIGILVTADDPASQLSGRVMALELRRRIPGARTVVVGLDEFVSATARDAAAGAASRAFDAVVVTGRLDHATTAGAAGLAPQDALRHLVRLGGRPPAVHVVALDAAPGDHGRWLEEVAAAGGEVASTDPDAGCGLTIPHPAVLASRLADPDVLARRRRHLAAIGVVPEGRFVAVDVAGLPVDQVDDRVREAATLEADAAVVVVDTSAPSVVRWMQARSERSLVPPLNEPLSSNDLIAVVSSAAALLSASRAVLAIASGFGVPGGPPAGGARRIDVPPAEDATEALDHHFDRLAQAIFSTTPPGPAYVSRAELEDRAQAALAASSYLRSALSRAATRETGPPTAPRAVSDARVAALEGEVARLRAELAALNATKVLRLLRPLRALYARATGRSL